MCAAEVIRTLMMLLLTGAAFAYPGIAPETALSVPNAGFDQGTLHWSGSGSAWTAAGDSVRPTHLRTQLNGQSQLSQTLYTVAGNAALASTKLEGQAWVWLETGHSSDAHLELHAHTPQGTVLLTRSPSLTTAVRGRWVPVRTSATQCNPTPTNMVALELRMIGVGKGGFAVDELAVGAWEREAWDLCNAGFEQVSQWTLMGPAYIQADLQAYYGVQALHLVGTGRAAALQSIDLGSSERSPRFVDRAQAGTWVYVETNALLPATADPRVRVDLMVRAHNGQGSLTSAPVVAQGTLYPTQAMRGRWLWLCTNADSASPLPASTERVVIEIRKQLRGTVRVDACELGEVRGVHGMSRRHLSASYVGRFRSPLWPQAQPVANDLHARWGTWAWATPPACDATLLTLAHQPDQLRANARRDVAVTTLQGPDWLPLAGAYDSRDPDLLAWHVHLLRASGCDSVLYDFDGHALAEHEQSLGRESVNLQTLRALYDACEAQGDLKVGLMIEPKIHLQGWLPNAGSFAQRVQAIEDDLVRALVEFGPRRATLRRDGAVVVYAFHNGVCAPQGLGCLTTQDWNGLVQRAQQRSGERVYLMADDVPNEVDTATTTFQATARWSLVTQPILAYPTWGQFVAQQTQPTTGAALAAFAADIHYASRQWAARADTERHSVGIVWPGFDDSGVAGWSGANLPGTDGQDLCVRVVGECGGDVLGTTWQAATQGVRDWIVLATFNDWNEWTQVEPRFHAQYVQAVVAGVEPASTARTAVFERLWALQARAAAWKQESLLPDVLDMRTRTYLQQAQQGLVTRYD